MKRLALGLSALLCVCLSGRSHTLLTVEIENYVPYHVDVPDPATFASSPAIVPGTARVFQRFVFIGDIVAVNGEPAKGIWTATATNILASPTPPPKQAIADAVRQNIIEMYFDLLQADGTPVGTIMVTGLTRGSPPPGAPMLQTGDSMAIIGGTGAFLGARGQAGVIDIGSPRQASAMEDPANRRINGGATRSYILQLIPTSTPEIETTETRPAILHDSDSSLVTAAKPAHAGEVLTLYATGLGPTFPVVDTAKSFPTTGPHVMTSSVNVVVNGTAIPVMDALGRVGTVSGYQVKFRLPNDTPPGLAAVSLKAAWISGASVTIPVH